MQSGYVALLDVLGFSALVSGDQGLGHLNQYLACLQEVFEPESSSSVVDYVVFSDSIVLTTQEDSEIAFQALIARCSRVFGLMLHRQIAIRGAISHGAFLRVPSRTGVFVAGSSIVDAYNFETKQDWVGIMLAPSAISQVPDLAQRCRLDGLNNVEEATDLRNRLPWAAFVQRCTDIPFHPEAIAPWSAYDGFAVVPSTGVAKAQDLHRGLIQCVNDLERLKWLAPDPRAQEKYIKTDLWLREIARRWEPVVHFVTTRNFDL